MTRAQIWAAALCTIAVYTYLYKENPIWRWAEHTFVALATGYAVAYNFHKYIKPTIITDIPGGKWHLIIPLIMGLLIYTMWFPRYSWLARIPISFWVGYGAGYVLGYNVSPFLGQVRGNFIALAGMSGWEAFSNILLVVGVLAVLMYFFFTVRRTSAVVQAGSTLGRYVIMVALGASYGNTVLYRFTLFLGRMQLLLLDWLQLKQV